VRESNFNDIVTYKDLFEQQIFHNALCLQFTQLVRGHECKAMFRK